MSNKSPYEQEKTQKNKGEILRRSGQNYFAGSDKKYNKQINQYYDSNTNSKNLKNSNYSKELRSTVKNLFGSKKTGNSLYPNHDEDEKYEKNHQISSVNEPILKEIEDIKTEDVIENNLPNNDTKLKLFNNKNLVRDNSSLNKNSIKFNQISIYSNDSKQNKNNNLLLKIFNQI